MKINTNDQFYKGILVNCIPRRDYRTTRAKRFTINGTNQNVWIPNKHLEEDGTIKTKENIDYVFVKSWKQCALAGINIVERLMAYETKI